MNYVILHVFSVLYSFILVMELSSNVNAKKKNAFTLIITAVKSDWTHLCTFSSSMELN